MVVDVGPVFVVVFTESAGVGVEAAEELAKATGVCVSVRAERPLNGLHGGTDTEGEERRKAGIRCTEDLTPVDCLFLCGEAEKASRCSSHNIRGCVSLSLDRGAPCEHLVIPIKSCIVLVVS